MPFIEINHARLYYEAFGADRPNRAPIVLIHGSTVTGRADWESIAPLLAREYRVIVPDCRGHGQSANPTQSYSFKEMANDITAFIRALGYERAHVIGHSNGGNVALVTLLKHPEVIQTCIPQAANAYVSQDLIDREPAVFDPERVAREAPHWRDEMIALHGPTHGAEYWRTLLALTLKETISAPNYSAEDLARTQKPVLVIQGADDPVNASARHAQFIADHIPLAERWIPAGVAHNVHLDAPLEWLQRVQDFLSRRGDDRNEALHQLKHTRYSDSRATLFAVRAKSERLTGQVLTEKQRQAAVQVTQGLNADDVTVLVSDSTPWALVQWAVADVRREPRSLAERVSQVLLGETVQVLDAAEEWVRVRVLRDGYLGYVKRAALHRCTHAEAQAYAADTGWRVVGGLAPVRELASNHAPVSGHLPMGVILPADSLENGFRRVHYPKQTTGWVDATHLLPAAEKLEAAFVLERVRELMGTPYLWGGRTAWGYDCSGLAGAFWGMLGVTIPRDADQQFAAGAEVLGQPQPGDLLFFAEGDETSGRAAHITHVAISLGGEEMIHATGAVGGITRNSLNPASPIYRAWLKEHLAGVRRFC